MANPSNKKDGTTYLLKTFTKDQLADRCAEQQVALIEEKAKYDTLQKEFNDLKRELEQLKRQYKRLNIPEERIKNVLELKAQNKVPVEIRDRMALRGFDISLDEIKSIYYGDLGIDEQLMYQQFVDKYIETIKINTKYYKQSSIEEQNKLLGYSYENLENCDKFDTGARQKIIDSISGIIKKRDELMRNIDETAELTEEDIALNETTENFKEMSNKIININLGNIKKIGGGA